MSSVQIQRSRYQPVPDYDASRLFLFLTALAGLLAIATPPLAKATGHPLLAAVGYWFFSPICHQIPDRTFFLFGHPLALCARCTGLLLGISTGAALALAHWAQGRPFLGTRRWLVAAILLMFADFASPLIGLYQNTLYTRLITGLLVGHNAAPYVIIGWAELMAIKKNEGGLVFMRKKGIGGEITA
jgi:uncharacterized membrane protein